jgi:hypothetical protein
MASKLSDQVEEEINTFADRLDLIVDENTKDIFVSKLRKYAESGSRKHTEEQLLNKIKTRADKLEAKALANSEEEQSEEEDDPESRQQRIPRYMQEVLLDPENDLVDVVLTDIDKATGDIKATLAQRKSIAEIKRTSEMLSRMSEKERKAFYASEEAVDEALKSSKIKRFELARGQKMIEATDYVLEEDPDQAYSAVFEKFSKWIKPDLVLQPKYREAREYLTTPHVKTIEYELYPSDRMDALEAENIANIAKNTFQKQIDAKEIEISRLLRQIQKIQNPKISELESLDLKIQEIRNLSDEDFLRSAIEQVGEEESENQKRILLESRKAKLEELLAKRKQLELKVNRKPTKYEEVFQRIRASVRSYELTNIVVLKQKFKDLKATEGKGVGFEYTNQLSELERKIKEYEEFPIDEYQEFLNNQVKIQEKVQKLQKELSDLLDSTPTEKSRRRIEGIKFEISNLLVHEDLDYTPEDRKQIKTIRKRIGELRAEIAKISKEHTSFETSNLITDYPEGIPLEIGVSYIQPKNKRKYVGNYKGKLVAITEYEEIDDLNFLVEFAGESDKKVIPSKDLKIISTPTSIKKNTFSGSVECNLGDLVVIPSLQVLKKKVQKTQKGRRKVVNVKTEEEKILGVVVDYDEKGVTIYPLPSASLKLLLDREATLKVKIEKAKNKVLLEDILKDVQKKIQTLKVEKGLVERTYEEIDAAQAPKFFTKKIEEKSPLDSLLNRRHLEYFLEKYTKIFRTIFPAPLLTLPKKVQPSKTEEIPLLENEAIRRNLSAEWRLKCFNKFRDEPGIMELAKSQEEADMEVTPEDITKEIISEWGPIFKGIDIMSTDVQRISQEMVLLLKGIRQVESRGILSSGSRRLKLKLLKNFSRQNPPSIAEIIRDSVNEEICYLRGETVKGIEGLTLAKRIIEIRKSRVWECTEELNFSRPSKKAKRFIDLKLKDKNWVKKIIDEENAIKERVEEEDRERKLREDEKVEKEKSEEAVFLGKYSDLEIRKQTEQFLTNLFKNRTMTLRQALSLLAPFELVFNSQISKKFAMIKQYLRTGIVPLESLFGVQREVLAPELFLGEKWKDPKKVKNLEEDLTAFENFLILKIGFIFSSPYERIKQPENYYPKNIEEALIDVRSLCGSSTRIYTVKEIALARSNQIPHEDLVLQEEKGKYYCYSLREIIDDYYFNDEKFSRGPKKDKALPKAFLDIVKRYRKPDESLELMVEGKPKKMRIEDAVKYVVEPVKRLSSEEILRPSTFTENPKAIASEDQKIFYIWLPWNPAYTSFAKAIIDEDVIFWSDSLFEEPRCYKFVTILPPGVSPDTLIFPFDPNSSMKNLENDFILHNQVPEIFKEVKYILPVCHGKNFDEKLLEPFLKKTDAKMLEMLKMPKTFDVSLIISKIKDIDFLEGEEPSILKGSYIDQKIREFLRSDLSVPFIGAFEQMLESRKPSRKLIPFLSSQFCSFGYQEEYPFLDSDDLGPSTDAFEYASKPEVINLYANLMRNELFKRDYEAPTNIEDVENAISGYEELTSEQQKLYERIVRKFDLSGKFVTSLLDYAKTRHHLDRTHILTDLLQKPKYTIINMFSQEFEELEEKVISREWSKDYPIFAKKLSSEKDPNIRKKGYRAFGYQKDPEKTTEENKKVFVDLFIKFVNSISQEEYKEFKSALKSKKPLEDLIIFITGISKEETHLTTKRVISMINDLGVKANATDMAASLKLLKINLQKVEKSEYRKIINLRLEELYEKSSEKQKISMYFSNEDATFLGVVKLLARK